VELLVFHNNKLKPFRRNCLKGFFFAKYYILIL
jgi:hypothetical protein